MTTNFKLESTTEVKVEVIKDGVIEGIEQNRDFFAIYVRVQEEKTEEDRQKNFIEVFRNIDNEKVLLAEVKLT